MRVVAIELNEIPIHVGGCIHGMETPHVVQLVGIEQFLFLRFGKVCAHFNLISELIR
jgi:hypothetical protein